MSNLPKPRIVGQRKAGKAKAKPISWTEWRCVDGNSCMLSFAGCSRSKARAIADKWTKITGRKLRVIKVHVTEATPRRK